MERIDDVRRRLEEKRGAYCTAQRVREAITVSLIGMRMKLHAGETSTHQQREYLRSRSKEIRDQLRLLLHKGRYRHVKAFLRVLHSYEGQIEDAARMADGDGATLGP
jgi:hypothetical protein